VAGGLTDAMLRLLEQAGVAVAVFEHAASGDRRTGANREWAALGGRLLDAVVLGGGFVEEVRLIETSLEQGGRVTPILIRTSGTLAGGLPTTVAVATLPAEPGARHLAHDLSNPLTYLLIHLRRLKDALPGLVPDGDRAAVERLLDEALDGGERVARIMRDLVSGSRR
jgi:signal transduction histidine kinase